MPHKDGTLKGYEINWVARAWLQQCAFSPLNDQPDFDQFLKDHNLSIRETGWIELRDKNAGFDRSVRLEGKGI